MCNGNPHEFDAQGLLGFSNGGLGCKAWFRQWMLQLTDSLSVVAWCKSGWFPDDRWCGRISITSSPMASVVSDRLMRDFQPYVPCQWWGTWREARAVLLCPVVLPSGSRRSLCAFEVRIGWRRTTVTRSCNHRCLVHPLLHMFYCLIVLLSSIFLVALFVCNCSLQYQEGLACMIIPEARITMPRA